MGHTMNGRHGLLLFLLLALSGTPARSEDRYRVTVHEDFAGMPERVSVEACFDGAPPGALMRHPSAAGFTTALRAGSTPLSDPGGRKLSLPELRDGACVGWTVDLAAAAAVQDRRLALRHGDSIVSGGNLWFWRDAGRRPIRVEVALPAGLSISVPWRTRPHSDNHLVFRPEPTSAYWSSRIAIGRFDQRLMELNGATLRLAIVGAGSRTESDRLASWIRESADSVASVTGHFPQPEPQILVIVLGPQPQPVPWAHVIRGGGVAVELFVDGTRPLASLREDWTATHELSHLLLPYVSSRDRWLSEGLASYYQNVLRARDGRLDAAAAWEQLESGFGRGRQATTGGSLASATRAGRDATMRVYWSGAAILLKADAQLRALSGGARSLDTALAGLHECCLDPARSWRAADLLARLDELTGYDVFGELYRTHVPDEAFPDLSEVYGRLGLVPAPDGIRFDPDAPWARIRYFIMNAPGTEAARPGDTGR